MLRRVLSIGFATFLVALAGASSAAGAELRLAFTPGAFFGLNPPGLVEGFSDDFMLDIGGLAWTDSAEFPIARLELGLGALSGPTPGIRAMAHVSIFTWENGFVALGAGVAPLRDVPAGVTYVTLCAAVQILMVTPALDADFGKLEIGAQVPVGYDHFFVSFYVGVGIEWYF